MNVNAVTSKTAMSSRHTSIDSEAQASCSAQKTSRGSKVVRFSEDILVKKVQRGGRKSSVLSRFAEIYRRHVDVQAKKNGLVCAFGHDDPHTDPKDYNHAVALKALDEETKIPDRSFPSDC